MEAHPETAFPFILVKLTVIGGLFLCGLFLLIRKFGGGKILLSLALLLPVLAVVLILLSLVSFRQHTVEVVNTEAAWAMQQHEQRMAEFQAKHHRRLVESHTGNQFHGDSHHSNDVAPPVAAPPAPPVAERATFSSTFPSAAATWHLSVPKLPVWMTLVVLFMVLLSSLIGASVYFAAQGGTLQWRAVGSKLLSILWVIPAVLIAAVPMLMIAGRIAGHSIQSLPSTTAYAVPDYVEGDDYGADSTSSKDLPDWINAPQQQTGNSRTVVVSSGYSPAIDATSGETKRALAAAQAELDTKSAEKIREYFSETYPLQGYLPIPRELVISATNDTYLMEKEVDGGGKVFRRFAQLELTPILNQRLLPSWQKLTVQHRLWALCTGLGILTLITGTMATYLRLDRMTAGAYRGRLKLASLSIIAAGSLVAMRLVV